MGGRNKKISKEKRIEAAMFSSEGEEAKHLELAQQYTHLVIDTLGDFISEGKRSAIDFAVSNRTNHFHVAVEGVHDSHNTAAVMRTSDAFGIQNVHVIEHQMKFLSSVNVTKGAHKWIDLSFYSGAALFCRQMRQQGLKVYAADMGGDLTVDKISAEEPAVLVFGNEAEGISSQMRELCDDVFHVPMYGFVESLNVSVAAAISISTIRNKGIPLLDVSAREILRARFYLKAVRAGARIVTRQLAQGQ